MLKKLVAIHGIGGLEKDVFFSHLKEFAENLGLKVYMPSLGSYHEGATYESWKQQIDEKILSEIDSETIVVTQSIGTQFAVKYLAEKEIEVGAYISCAGPKNVLSVKKAEKEHAKRFHSNALTFVPSKKEFEIFKNLNFPKYSFYSNNDNFFTVKNLEAYADAIDSKKIFIKNMGHFNVPEIKNGFEGLEKLIENLVSENF